MINKTIVIFTLVYPKRIVIQFIPNNNYEIQEFTVSLFAGDFYDFRLLKKIKLLKKKIMALSVPIPFAKKFYYSCGEYVGSY